jgi:hypothetical protein
MNLEFRIEKSEQKGAKMAVKLGERYKDSVTGYVGVATARVEYLSDFSRVLLESIIGNTPKEYWFEATRLMEVKGPGGPGKVAPSRDPDHRQ